MNFEQKDQLGKDVNTITKWRKIIIVTEKKGKLKITDKKNANNCMVEYNGLVPFFSDLALSLESRRCENSFVDSKINYENLCYLLRKIWTDPTINTVVP